VADQYVYLVPQQTAAATPAADNALDLDALLRILKSRWKLITVVTLIFLGLGIAKSVSAPKIYQAEVVLLPAKKQASLRSSLSQLSDLGGMAGMAGVSLPSAEVGEPLAFLKSKDFIRAVILDNNLLPVLYAKRWDAANHRWKNPDTKKQPDIRDGVRYFDNNIRTVLEDKKTGIVTLTVEWQDSQVAAEWANLLVKHLNDRMRQRAIADSGRSVSYLQQEIAATNVVSLQQSLGRVLESEMQKLLLAQANEEFAFKVIDTAYPAKRPSNPSTVLVGLCAGLLGFLLSVVSVLISARRRMSPAP